MKNRSITEKLPVLFLDSGIGGIPYCRHFLMRNPNERTVYLADRLHFPYGEKGREEIAEIIIDITERTVKIFNPKIVILACNTASVSALTQLRQRFPSLPFVGTVPAIKPAALSSKTGKIGVLGTELTIKEPYIRSLADKNGGGEIISVAAPELVEFVERKISSATKEEKEEIARHYIDRFRHSGADVIVLGCTHFLFLINEFKNESSPEITVFDSVEGVTRQTESILTKIYANEKKESNDSFSNNLFLLTGKSKPEPSWEYWANYLDFDISLLEEE